MNTKNLDLAADLFAMVYIAEMFPIDALDVSPESVAKLLAKFKTNEFVMEAGQNVTPQQATSILNRILERNGISLTPENITIQ